MKKEATGTQPINEVKQDKYELRYSERGGYWFIDELIGGEGYTRIIFHPDYHEKEAENIMSLLNTYDEMLAALQEAKRYRLTTHHGDDKLLKILNATIRKATNS